MRAMTVTRSSKLTLLSPYPPSFLLSRFGKVRELWVGFCDRTEAHEPFDLGRLTRKVETPLLRTGGISSLGAHSAFRGEAVYSHREERSFAHDG
jgi:hypothetical protein